MRNILAIVMFCVSAIAFAQDYTLFERLQTIETPDDAKVVSDKLAAQLKGKFVYYKLKEFDNGLLRIVYVPEGMTEEAIKIQADYEDCFVVDFKAIAADQDKAYRFDKAKAKYDILFPLWKQSFKPDAATDRKTQRFADAEKGYLYSFINLGDVWAIGR